MFADTIQACVDTGMSSPAVAVIYETEPGQYAGIAAPDNWTFFYSKMSMAGAMRFVFEEWPDEEGYGWLADDIRPRTQGWDKTLESYVERWHIVTNADGWVRGQMSGVPIYPGDMCRLLGWYAPPGYYQAGLDDIWWWMGTQLGNIRFIGDVVTEHLTHHTGKRQRDATDDLTRDGVDWLKHDRALQHAFTEDGEGSRCVALIRERWAETGFVPSDHAG